VKSARRSPNGDLTPDTGPKDRLKSGSQAPQGVWNARFMFVRVRLPTATKGKFNGLLKNHSPFGRHLGRGQLFFAPCATHFLSTSIFSLGMDSLPCGIFMEGSARPSTSMIMTLLRLSPGLTMLPNLVPFIRLS